MPDLIEELLEVKQWRTGYEFLDKGRWLEVINFRTQGNHKEVWVNAMDWQENRRRTFLIEPGQVRRTRYPKDEA